MINITELKGGEVMEVQASGKLTDEDYQRWVPEFERLIGMHGKISLLFEMVDFHGWDARAAWDDMKLTAKHFNHIERIAMVGDKKWQEWMTAFCKPFTRAKVRYFDISETELARAWVGLKEMPTPVGHH